MTAAQHLGIEELEARFRGSKDVVERAHFQVIFLLAQGHAKAAVARMTALTPRWVSAIARRYEEQGAAALGDRRRHNAGARPLLSEEDLEALRERLTARPTMGACGAARKWRAGSRSGWGLRMFTRRAAGRR